MAALVGAVMDLIKSACYKQFIAAYEVAAFIRNPIPELLELDTLSGIIHNRITHFSEILALPSQRIPE